MRNASAQEIRRELWALVRLTRKGSTIERRQPYFATASVLLSVEWVLPVVLATIALAGPNATGLENFVNSAGTDNYLAFTVIGATTFLWIGWTTTVLASDLRQERNLGTLPTIWASATSRLVLISGGPIGRTLWPSVVAVGAFAIAWAFLRFPLEPNIGPGAAAMVCGLLASVGIAFAWAAIVLRYREGHFLEQLFLMGSGILAGIAYPAEVLPAWGQWIGNVFPATWMLRGLRAAFIFGELDDVRTACVVLLGMALAYGAIGLGLLHVMDAAARAKGELEWV